MGEGVNRLRWAAGLVVDSIWRSGNWNRGGNAPSARGGRGRRRSQAAIEPLEQRVMFTWTGATSGSTNDAAHNYNNTANWANGVIDDSFDGVSFSANTTLFLSANRITGSAGLNLNYTGTADLTIASNSSTARTLTLGGNITGSFGGSGNTVTIGVATNLVNVTLGGNTAVNVRAATTLVTNGAVSNNTLIKQGGGVLDIAGTVANSSLTLDVEAGTVKLDKAAGTSGNAALAISNVATGASVLLSGGATNLLPNSGTINLGGGTLDLAGHSQGWDQLSGTGTVTNTGSATATLTLGLNNGSSTFSGCIQNGTNSINIVKSGTGIFTLGGQYHPGPV